MIAEALLAISGGLATRAFIAQIDLLQASGIEKLLTNVGLPVLVALGCYLLLRDASKRDQLRHEAREKSQKDILIAMQNAHRDAVVNSEQTAREMIAAFDRRMLASEARDERRELFVTSRIAPLQTHLEDLLKTLDAISKALEGNLAEVIASVERHTAEDKLYRQQIVTPALKWVKHMPAVIEQVGVIRARLDKVEQALSDTGQLAPAVSPEHEGD